MREEYAQFIVGWLSVFGLIYYGARLNNERFNNPTTYFKKITILKFKCLIWLKGNEGKVLQFCYYGQLIAIGALLFGILVLLILILLNLIFNIGDVLINIYLYSYPFVILFTVALYYAHTFGNESRERKRLKKKAENRKKNDIKNNWV